MNLKFTTRSKPQESAGHSCPDFWVTFHGSIALFHPGSPAARRWLDEHCPAGADHQYFAGALCVEHRYWDDLLHFVHRDGLALKLTTHPN
jgi:hypothetical protein